MFFNRFTALVCGVFICMAAISQGKDIDYKFGNVTAKDFDIPKDTVIDKDAAAIVLYDAGSTHFIGNKKGWFSYICTSTRKIKIINKKAFDLATVGVGLYTKDNDAEVLSNVKAVTYNINNGAVSSVSIDKKDIFSEQKDKNHILKKFTLPGVQEGSIIEYTYTVTSDYIFNIPGWDFQSIDYPTLWSEYSVSIPVSLNYVSSQQGTYPLYIKKAWESTETYAVTNPADNSSLGLQDQKLSVTAATSHIRWVKKNIPALKIENFISSLHNYVDKIEFQLSSTFNGTDTRQVMNTWESACKEILKEDDFEKLTENNSYWIKDLDEFVNGESNLDAAKKIYYFIQSNYTCTDSQYLFKPANLLDVYKSKKGSVRGINLLLTVMLRDKGMTAKPVLLSTREHGFVNPLYPLIEKFNYLICQLKINDQTFLLDASNPVLGFGDIADKCYNGYARAVDNHPDSLYLSADSLHETEMETTFLSSDKDGKISGTYKCILGKIQSADMRERMRKTNKDEYTKEVKKNFLFEVEVTNATIDSLKQPEMPVAVQYDVSFKPEENLIYFNPLMFGNMYSENPFKATQRFYPVEMPYCIDKIYILNMEVPAGYKVDELPKSARVSLNENEGMFEYLIQQNGDNIQLRCLMKLNKATFDKEDYETLRNFFAFVVEKEGEQIVFKKQ